ncbi:MAG: right-handed parallel beta-helix repeat-containing protein, partial [Anaerolineales bacterium]|nr:right-handed parallel beta-helix repeat-containing protein [Anaerolineales bacterium]
LILLSSFIVIASAATPVYVRSDGDDVNCDGTANVAYPGSGSGLACAFKTIQKGVDSVDPGGTVYVAAGTYSDPVNIVSLAGITIEGADKNTVIVKPSTTLCWNVGVYVCDRKAAIRAVSSTDVVLKNLTLDMDLVKGNNIIGIFYWDTTGTVDNTITKNNSVPDASGGYYEIASYFRAPSYTDAARAQITFSNNTMIDTGRVGMVIHDFVNINITGSTFYKLTDDFGYAIELGSEATGTISGNTIYGYDTPAASDGSNSAGIYIENAFTGGVTGITKNVTIEGNEIYDCQYALYIGNEFDTYAGDVDIVVNATGNYFHDNVDGAIYITDEDKEYGSSVTYTGSGNTLTDNGGVGYFLSTSGDGDLDVTLTDEMITGHDIGVYLNDSGTPPSGSSYAVSIQNSNISGNATYGVQNDYAGASIGAENNWWGCAAGPGQPGCDAVYENPGTIDFSPYLTAPPDVYVDAVTGSDLTGDGTAGNPYATIQKGISEVRVEGTIRVAAGTYNEVGQLVIDKNMSIVGADRATVIIKPTANTTNSGDGRAWFLVQAGVQFDLSGATLDGTGFLIFQAIRQKGSGTIDQVDFKEIKYNESGTDYAGFAIAAFGTGNVDVTDSTFTQIGRVGVLYFGATITGSTFQGNTYTGKGAGNWLDYALDISAGAVVDVLDNTITNNLGVASSDGSISAGILVTTYYGAGTQATITGNVITGNTEGIAVGYNASDTSTVVASLNNLSGNTDDGISSTNPTVDGEYNWWGCIDGPGTAGCADKYGDVDHTPYLGNWPSSPGNNTYYVDPGDNADDVNDLISDVAIAGDTIVLKPGVHTPTGGYLVDTAGLTIIATGATIQPASPCFTVSADNTILSGGICEPSSGSDGIITGAAVNNLVIRDMEIRKGASSTGDGIHLAHSINNLQIIDNFIHGLDGDGLEYASGTAVTGVHEVQGNLFQNNTGYGVNNASGIAYDVTYNSWGDLTGPLGSSGDNITSNLTYNPWTHAALLMVYSGSPVPDRVGVGSQITYDIQIDAARLFGADFDLAFNRTLLSVVSITNSGLFTQALPGCALSTPAEANASGVISFCGQSFSEINGAALDVYTVVFQGVAPGVSPLAFDATDDQFAMAPPYGGSTNVYAAALTDGSVEVFDAFTISGRIDLQGRPNDTGAVMSFGIGLNQGYGPFVFSTSDYWGAISATGVVEDTYGITVSMARYLDVTIASAKSALIDAARTLATLVLFGGDANDDDIIDLGDATILGGQYGTPGPNGDINNDGIVNLQDLVLVGGNYLKATASAYAGWTP